MNSDHPTPWHTINTEEILRRTESSDRGLSQEQARQRWETVGPNELKAEAVAGPWRLIAHQINNPLIYLLMGAAALSLIAGKSLDAAVIVGVILLNTALGFVQEWRAEGALAALRRMAAPHARLLRAGETVKVDAHDVVPGDILFLETGDRIPADARLLSLRELRVDESALTGESEPVAKEADLLEEETPIADRRNMVWMSTHVTGGRGRAVVVETGMQTQMGQIAGQVRTTEREKTPLQQRMHRLGIVLGLLGVGWAGVVFVLGMLRSYEALEMLLFSVAVVVLKIKEGLPAVITVTLALGVRRMADRQAIIRRLPAVETLGSTTVICSDKTGTITENQMTVRRIWAGGRAYRVTGEGYRPNGEIVPEADTAPSSDLTLKMLLRIGVLCNNARMHSTDDGRQASGNPSEAALLVAATKGGIDPNTLSDPSTRLAEVPFSSDRKAMGTLHAKADGRGRIAFVKGAPDRLLEFASHIMMDGEAVPIEDKHRRQFLSINEEMAADALRVMAGAYRERPSAQDHLEESEIQQGLTLVGLWGIIDPPRAESAPAVAAAKTAGIRSVMITGDHALTAHAIAQQVGITESSHSLTAQDVEAMDHQQLAEAALKHGVFARVSPAHKLKIMEALKARGEVVAMTGDGVNDAPALKGADIGIAMGQAGTEVAKEAADMVLTDDNFSTIIAAVEEGRSIYSNLRRVIFFLLATNLGEILTLSSALMLGLDLPLTAVMILWVNLVTDGVCTIPLGLEPKHGNVLEHPPRDPDEPIVTTPMIRRMALLTPLMAVGTLGLFALSLQSNSLAYARTMAFTTLAAFQWFQTLNARSQFQSVFAVGPLTNRWLLVGLSAAVALQLIVVQTRLGILLFGTEPLRALDWVWILLVSSSIWIADEIFKQLGIHGQSSHASDG